MESVKREYFRRGELGSLRGVISGLADVLGRFMIKQPAYDFARLNSQHAPTYLMSFQYKGQHSYFDLIVPSESRDLLESGVSHGDDLLYLFYTGVLDLDERDQRIATKLTRILVNFAKAGKLSGLAPVSAYSTQYLKIDSNLSVQGNFTDTFR